MGQTLRRSGNYHSYPGWNIFSRLEARKGLLPTVSGRKSRNPAHQVEWDKQVLQINQPDIGTGRNYRQEYVAYSSVFVVCSASVSGMQTETNTKKHRVVLPSGIPMGFPRRTGAKGLQTI